jgi:DNA-binding response OmpR family regulator
MTARPNVLLVAPSPQIAANAMAGLTDAGLRVTVVTSFKAARASLEARPALLISEVRLGEYNGLHLALRARHQGIHAIVLGADDPVTRHEAESIGAEYLDQACDASRLAAAVHALGVQPHGRFRRNAIHAA